MKKPQPPGASASPDAAIILACAIALWLIAGVGMRRSKALERAAIGPQKAQPVVQPVVQPVAQPVAQPDRVWLEQLIINTGRN